MDGRNLAGDAQTSRDLNVTPFVARSKQCHMQDTCTRVLAPRGMQATSVLERLGEAERGIKGVMDAALTSRHERCSPITSRETVFLHLLLPQRSNENFSMGVVLNLRTLNVHQIIATPPR